jgi:hypothetical protein
MRQRIGEGSDARSETKINNLKTDKYGSNPPLKKKHPAISILQPTFRREQLEFLKIFLKCLNNMFKNSYT